jgi:hypothetical protein
MTVVIQWYESYILRTQDQSCPSLVVKKIPREVTKRTKICSWQEILKQVLQLRHVTARRISIKFGVAVLYQTLSLSLSLAQINY